jgi:glycosyltransferase involved in cell wall biosynthesis
LYFSRKRNFQDIVGAYLGRCYDLISAKKYDLLWIEKEVFPYLPGIFDRLVKILDVPYILDYDDAIFHTYDKSRSSVIRGLLSNKLQALIKSSEGVFVGNSYLADYALMCGAKNVLEIPTVIDLERYVPVQRATGGETLRVGWIGTPQTTKYLGFAVDALRATHKKIPVTLVLIGASALGDVGFPIEHHEWTLDSEVELLNSIDVGIMPLPDAAWERGKCGYKLIQYMALGKPVIASPVGINTEIVTPLVGFLPRTIEEWSDAMIALYQSQSLRLSLSQNARTLVVEKYHTGVVAPQIIKFFNEVIT